MPSRLIKAETLLAIELLAFWPVWRWYVHRLSDQSDEAWGIVALVTAALFVFLWRPEGDPDAGRSKQATLEQQEPRIFTDAMAQRGLSVTIRRIRLNPWFLLSQSSMRLMLPAMLLLCYALSYHFLSPLPRAMIAVTAIAATISVVRFGKRLHLGVWGLLLLALPVIASLQFYLGFPMRTIVAKLAAPMRPNVTNEQSAFPGWPSQLEGRSLTQLPLSSREERFAADFPGRIARFSDGGREIIIRWVTRETRALHPASDCFKGLGYSIKPLPARIDPDGHRWAGFEARRGDESLRVHERIYDSADKESWSDVSSWYWQAMTGKTKGGWWAVTVAERQ